MAWHQFALFAAPLGTVFIAFLLDKYLQNKPRLVVYRGYVSVHKIPFNSGYNIYSLEVKTAPNIAMMNRQYGNNLPAIIKHGKDIWIYGLDENGKPHLTQSKDVELFESIEFKDKLVSAERISPNIYDYKLSVHAHMAKTFICTHSIVIRNAGRLPAHNVRIVHKILPDYHVYPNMQYNESRGLGSSGEILFPILVPNEQVTVSYLYFPPTVYSDINDYVKSDEGFARFIEVMPTTILPKWQMALIWLFLFIGCSSFIYFVILLVASVYRCLCS